MNLTGLSQSRPTLNPREVTAALNDAATYATVLHVIMLAQYGEDIYEVDPLELYARLKDDFGANLPEANEQRIQAILLATSTDAFYDDIRVFTATCNTLLAGDPGFESMDELSVAEIFWGLYEVELNHGEEEPCPEIQQMIAREVDEEAEDSTGIEELRPNYVLRELAEHRTNLRKQLLKIGIKDFDLPPVS